MSYFVLNNEGEIEATESTDLFITAGPDVEQTIQFIDQSLGATSVLWEFGDGAFSTVRNAAHVYPSSGAWVVRQTSSNDGGQISTVQRAVITTPCATLP